MATIQVSQATAQRVLRMIEEFETPARAAHELRVGQTAIQPYTDVASERTEYMLRRLARASEETRIRWLGQLRTIAAGG